MKKEVNKFLKHQPFLLRWFYIAVLSALALALVLTTVFTIQRQGNPPGKGIRPTDDRQMLCRGSLGYPEWCTKSEFVNGIGTDLLLTWLLGLILTSAYGYGASKRLDD